MRRVGPGLARGIAAVRVILPDQRRIALPGLDVRQLVMAASALVRPLENRDPALRADARAGQDKDFLHQKVFTAKDAKIAKERIQPFTAECAENAEGKTD